MFYQVSTCTARAAQQNGPTSSIEQHRAAAEHRITQAARAAALRHSVDQWEHASGAAEQRSSEQAIKSTAPTTATAGGELAAAAATASAVCIVARKASSGATRRERHPGRRGMREKTARQHDIGSGSGDDDECSNNGAFAATIATRHEITTEDTQPAAADDTQLAASPPHGSGHTVHPEPPREPHHASNPHPAPSSLFRPTHTLQQQSSNGNQPQTPPPPSSIHSTPPKRNAT